MNKNWTFVILAISLAVMFFVFWQTSQKQPPIQKDQSPPAKVIPSEKDKPQIVSTNPEPLDRAVISSDTQIEITFNRPLENEGEFKFRIEPEIKYKLNLSNERKTVKIIPQEPFDLSHGYSLYITGDSKFTGYGPWGEEKSFHFQTIKYRGV